MIYIDIFADLVRCVFEQKFVWEWNGLRYICSIDNAILEWELLVYTLVRIYIYIYMCVCVCVCDYTRACVHMKWVQRYLEYR